MKKTVGEIFMMSFVFLLCLLVLFCAWKECVEWNKLVELRYSRKWVDTPHNLSPHSIDFKK